MIVLNGVLAYLQVLELSLKIHSCGVSVSQSGGNVTQNCTHKQLSQDHGEAGKHWKKKKR